MNTETVTVPRELLALLIHSSYRAASYESQEGFTDLARTTEEETNQAQALLDAPPPSDTERLDWLESQSNGQCWIARPSTTGRGYRLHNTSQVDGDARMTARAAIDAAREGGRADV